MSRPRHRGGRATPKGTRPSHLRSVPNGPSRSPLDDLIDSGAEQLLDEASAVAAETWASGALRFIDGVLEELGESGQPLPPLVDDLLRHCAARHDTAGAVVAAALAAVMPAPHDRTANELAGRLLAAVPNLPDWVHAIGHATPTKAWVAGDPWGDQESLIIGFTQPGEPGEHALVALVDHGLSGEAKDLWLAADAAETAAAWRTAGSAEEGMRFADLPVDEALARLREAMAAADFWDGDEDLRSEGFADHRALVWARLRRAGHHEGPPSTVAVPEAERAAIVADFLASPEGKTLTATVNRTEAQMLVTSLVGLRADFEGRPLRWSPQVVTELLLDMIPRHVLLADDQQHAVPEVIRAFVRYAGRRSGLAPEHIDATVEAVDDAEAAFLGLAADPSSGGPTKAMLTQLAAEGVDVGDLDALRDALDDRFGPAIPAPWPAIRPGAAASAPPDVVASAVDAPVLASFATLAEFFGTGRKLTQTGNPTLADARALLERLGSHESLEQTYRGTVIKRRSASELPGFSFLLRWAVAAGALRKQHGKLMATASWAKLRPIDRWIRAVDKLTELGPLSGYFGNVSFRGETEPIDDLAPELLGRLAEGSMAAEALLDVAVERCNRLYNFGSGYMNDPEHRKGWLRSDLFRLLRLLAEAGVISWPGLDADDDLFHLPKVLEGDVELTAAGRWLFAGTGE